MKEIIKLNSRYGEDNYLEKIPDTNSYVLKVDTNIVRVGTVEDGKRFVDPSGGPMIVVGHTLLEAKAVVKSISFIDDVGWVITFQ